MCACFLFFLQRLPPQYTQMCRALTFLLSRWTKEQKSKRTGEKVSKTKEHSDSHIVTITEAPCVLLEVSVRTHVLLQNNEFYAGEGSRKGVSGITIGIYLPYQPSNHASPRGLFSESFHRFLPALLDARCPRHLQSVVYFVAARLKSPTALANSQRSAPELYTRQGVRKPSSSAQVFTIFFLATHIAALEKRAI